MASITEERGGNGWTIWVTAVCTCGWRGMTCWGFQDPNYYVYMREKAAHVCAPQKKEG